MREAGLPRLVPQVGGERQLLGASKGVVRAVYPETSRVDIETEDGAILTNVIVVGPLLPEVHHDRDNPQHVVYMHMRGLPDAVCWPLPHRRLLAGQDTPAGHEGQAQPERRYFPLHGFIFRSGDITMRITQDNRFVLEGEAGDFIQYDQNTREVLIQAPSVFIGTELATRIEYEQDEVIRAFMPVVLVGTEVADRIEYKQGTHILLQAPLIKLTAESIILDPTSIKLGHENATERVLLGDLWMSLYNTFVTLFNGHTHSNVQNGPSVSGPPVTPTVPMTEAVLSDVARVSKTGL